MHRIDGPGATVDGKFTEGDPVGGVQATVVTDDFLNDVQEELISLLTAAGVSPVKGTQDQVLQAIYKLAQGQKATAFTTSGTSTALTLTPTPAIPSYAAPQRFNVKFSVSSGLNPTLNVSAKGPKPLKQYDAAGAKVAAVFFADQVSDVMYDGVDFVLLDPIASVGQASETVSGGLKIAPLALVNALANDLTAVTPLKLGSGFSTTKAANGYIKLPEWLGGLILQWGTATTTNSSAVVSYPLVFPNSVLMPPQMSSRSGTVQWITWTTTAISNTGFTAGCGISYSNGNFGSGTFSWWAVGH